MKEDLEHIGQSASIEDQPCLDRRKILLSGTAFMTAAAVGSGAIAQQPAPGAPAGRSRRRPATEHSGHLGRRHRHLEHQP